jgi:single-strand DNA-binding protein
MQFCNERYFKGGSMINKVILIGHVGRDPEFAYTSNQMSVCKFSLATTTKVKDSETTEWHNIVVFNKLADLINKYVKKGSKLYLEGKIQYESWEKKDGSKDHKTVILANTVQFLSTNKDQQKEPEQTDYAKQAEKIFTNDDVPF